MTDAPIALNAVIIGRQIDPSQRIHLVFIVEVFIGINHRDFRARAQLIEDRRTQIAARCR
jgi:hypothetical protein